MRPHPLLAITSAILVLGAAGAIGDATITAKTALPLSRRPTSAGTYPRAEVRAALHVRLSSTLIDAYRTAPIPYLFSPAARHRRRERIHAALLAIASHRTTAGTKWLALRQCESGDNYALDTGNGYYGAYQFAASTWANLGYRGLPNTAPSWQQDAAAVRLEHIVGWSAWPVCSEVARL